MSTMSVLAVLLGLVVVVSASAEKSFFDLFSGEWDVQRAQVHLETNEVSYEAYKGHYSIGKDNHTESVLSGRFFDINTDDGEVFNEFNLRLEFDNNNRGRFLTGTDDDEMKELFPFEFTRTFNDVLLSHGDWKGSADSWYQFELSDADKFTITIYPKHMPATDATLTVYLGKRIIPPVEKTFWSQYGTMVMMGTFFCVQMFLKNKFAPEPPPRSAVPGGPPAPRSKATVEEIPKDK